MIALFLSLFLSFSAQATNPNEKEIKPTFQTHPFLALSHVEVNLEVGQQFALLKRRASELCEFAKAPAGRYRSRSALKMNTRRVHTLGQKIALLKKSGGNFTPSVAKVGKELRTETFSSITCVGNP